MESKKVVLLTGTSKGGLGDALARAFHARGYRVIATARNPAKVAHFEALGIETLTLDVLSSESIAASVAALSKLTDSRLDVLVNNSGGGYSMPLADVSIDHARGIFELNVWSVLAVTQAFLPLLLKAPGGGLIANQSSVVSVLPYPTSGIYNSSKAAVAHLTDTLRLELAPFGVKVVDLKTGMVRSSFYDNINKGEEPQLPEQSLYNVAKEEVEKVMKGIDNREQAVDADLWAKEVVASLIVASPPAQIWKGGKAWVIWFARRFLPANVLDSSLSKMGGMEAVKQKLGRT
ncbi:MAG: hypothetical protein M1838_001049 [Thelocarpon superellum]|nr:MAG: hypothetical protein M1838_001049 [Thelocarpon superellum]